MCLCVDGRAYSYAYFGAGSYSGPIYLDDVQCTSSSNQLLECPSRPILSHNCRHSADAGVGCEGMLCDGSQLMLPVAQLLILICHIQLLAQLASSDWQEVILQMKEEWKSVWTMCGALCAQTPGEMLMLQWYVDNWDIPPKVYRPATYIYLLEGSGVYFNFVLIFTNRCSVL